MVVSIQTGRISFQFPSAIGRFDNGSGWLISTDCHTCSDGSYENSGWTKRDNVWPGRKENRWHAMVSSSASTWKCWKDRKRLLKSRRHRVSNALLYTFIQICTDTYIHIYIHKMAYKIHYLQPRKQVRVAHPNPISAYTVYRGDLRGIRCHGTGGLQVTATKCNRLPEGMVFMKSAKESTNWMVAYAQIYTTQFCERTCK